VKTNFDIPDEISINYEGRLLDLHNDFEFISVSREVANKRGRLQWRNEANQLFLTLNFTNVNLFMAKRADEGYPPEEASTTTFIGFLDPRDVDQMNAFSREHWEGHRHFIVAFQDGSAIKFGASEAEVKITRNRYGDAV
jgi:hypothetical protein